MQIFILKPIKAKKGGGELYWQSKFHDQVILLLAQKKSGCFN